MNHCMLFTALLAVMVSTHASAADYLLRIDTVGYRNLSKDAKEPEPTLLESISVVARPDVPFYGNAILNSDKVTVSGVVENLTDGRLRVQVRCRKSAATGEFRPGPNGQKLPIYRTSDLDTAAIVELTKPVELGIDNSATRNVKGNELRNSTRTMLVLDAFDPLRN